MCTHVRIALERHQEADVVRLVQQHAVHVVHTVAATHDGLVGAHVLVVAQKHHRRATVPRANRRSLVCRARTGFARCSPGTHIRQHSADRHAEIEAVTPEVVRVDDP